MINPESTVQALGLLWVAKFTYDILIGVWRHFLRPSMDLTTLGDWALITGATDGIGLAIAEECVKKGLNVIIVGRSAEKLKDCQGQLLACGAEGKSGKVEVQTLLIDFADFNASKQADVRNAIAGKKIGLLVNNVGCSYPYCQYFTELDDDRVEQLIQLNVTSTTRMTRIVLPAMEARKKGAILNISSSAGRVNSPLLAQYSATKAYVEAFSVSLAAELQGKGIIVQSQSPFWVTTKLAKVRHASLLTPNTKTYAKAALRAIGYEWSSSPYWVHDLILYMFTRLPHMVQGSVANMMHHPIRKAGHKKYGKTA